MTSGEQLAQALRERIGAIVFGLDEVLHQLAIALLVQGHVLLEGPPGVGKTVLARSLATVTGGHFQRVQCTPELLPSDLTGVNVWRPDSARFEWLPGPLFADVVLVDELNRTGPRTQSALLEAMEERAVTVDRVRHALPEGFVIIATQNPHEFEGTFPLPESQLDRFLLRLRLGHPDPMTETTILRAYDCGDAPREQALAGLTPLEAGVLDAARAEMRAVHVGDAVYAYVTAIAAASRQQAGISLGLSSRGSLALMRCARAAAALQGIAFLTPDHIKQVATAVIAHRLVPSPEAALDGETPESLVASILAAVKVPRADPA